MYANQYQSDIPHQQLSMIGQQQPVSTSPSGDDTCSQQSGVSSTTSMGLTMDTGALIGCEGSSADNEDNEMLLLDEDDDDVENDELLGQCENTNTKRKKGGRGRGRKKEDGSGTPKKGRKRKNREEDGDDSEDRAGKLRRKHAQSFEDLQHQVWIKKKKKDNYFKI